MSDSGAGHGTALVTGASSGIGAEFARELARRGHDLVLVARDRERLETLAEELERSGVRAEVLVADLAEPEGLARVEAQAAGEPAISMLVNNAGFAHFGPFADESPEHMEAAVRVLAIATLRLSRAVLLGMAERGAGAIVNVSSRAAFGAHPSIATYGASKAFVNRLTQALAAEYEGRGVRLLAVCPGNVRTEFFERAGIDPDAIRGYLEPDRVVRESLAALEAGRTVCVPGERRRDRALRALLPRGAARRLAGILGRLAGC